MDRFSVRRYEQASRGASRTPPSKLPPLRVAIFLLLCFPPAAFSLPTLAALPPPAAQISSSSPPTSLPLPSSSTLKNVFLHQVEPPSFPYRLHTLTGAPPEAPATPPPLKPAPVTTLADKCSAASTAVEALQVALLQDVKHRSWPDYATGINEKMLQVSNDLSEAVRRVAANLTGLPPPYVGFFSDKLPVRSHAVCLSDYNSSRKGHREPFVAPAPTTDWLGGQWEAVGRCAKARFNLDTLCNSWAPSTSDSADSGLPLRVIILITDSMPHAHGDLGKILCSNSTEEQSPTGQTTALHRNCSVSHVDTFETLDSHELQYDLNARCELTEYPGLYTLAALLRELHIWLVILVEAATLAEGGVHGRGSDIPSEQRKFASTLSADKEGESQETAFLDSEWGVARMYQAMLNGAEVRSVIARVASSSDSNDLQETLDLALRTIAVKNCILGATESGKTLRSLCRGRSFGGDARESDLTDPTTSIPPPPMKTDVTNVRTEPASSLGLLGGSSATHQSAPVSSDGRLPNSPAEENDSRLGTTLAICSASVVAASLAVIGAAFLIRAKTVATFSESSSITSVDGGSNEVGVSATQRDVIESVSPSAYA